MTTLHRAGKVAPISAAGIRSSTKIDTNRSPRTRVPARSPLRSRRRWSAGCKTSPKVARWRGRYRSPDNRKRPRAALSGRRGCVIQPGAEAHAAHKTRYHRRHGHRRAAERQGEHLGPRHFVNQRRHTGAERKYIKDRNDHTPHGLTSSVHPAEQNDPIVIGVDGKCASWSLRQPPHVNHQRNTSRAQDSRLHRLARSAFRHETNQCAATILAGSESAFSRLIALGVLDKAWLRSIVRGSRPYDS